MKTNKADINVVKIFDAPVQSVWKYWSEPEYFKQWWGPAAATCIVCHMDFKVGGTFLHCLRVQTEQGKIVDMWATGTYKTIEPFKKIVFTDSFADEHGNVVPASYYGIKGVPRELKVTITFKDLGGKTHMTLTHAQSGTDQAARDAMEASWKESFNKIRRIVG